MPCRYEEPEPSAREIFIGKTIKTYDYIADKLGTDQFRMRNLKGIASNVLPDDTLRKGWMSADEVVEKTCTLIRSLTPEQVNEIIYNGRDKEARQAADWWDSHQEADQRREAAERKQKRAAELKKKAIGKLTDEERKALGV